MTARETRCVAYIVLLSCACTPRFVPQHGEPMQTPPDEEAVTSVVPTTPTTDGPLSGRCTMDVECGRSEDPQQFAVCEANECTRWDAAKMWAWATHHAPLIAELRPVVALADVPWVAPILGAGSLRVFVDARDVIWTAARCVPIDLRAHEGNLVADIPERLGTKPGTKNAWFYTLQLSAGAAVLGPGRITSGPNGEGAEGVGELQILGHTLVPDDRALRYTGARFAAELGCGGPTIERKHCEPKVCTGCTELALRKRSLESNVGFGGSAGVHVTVAGGPCDRCPDDAFGPLLPRLRAAMVGRQFIDDLGDDTGPVFHRTRKDCVAALRPKSTAPVGWR